MPVPLLPPPQPMVMPEPRQDSDSQGEQPQPAQLKSKQLPSKALPAAPAANGAVSEPDLEIGRPAAVDGEAAADGGEVEAPAGGRSAPAEHPEHDDNTAAELLLGMGSKSESDGGGSAGSSGRNRSGGVAAAARRRQQERVAAVNGSAPSAGGEEEEDEEEEGEEEEEDEEEAGGRRGGKGRRGGSLRRSTRRARTPAYRASELLGSASDDEFEPGSSKRAAKSAGGRTASAQRGRAAGAGDPAVAAWPASSPACCSCLQHKDVLLAAASFRAPVFRCFDRAAAFLCCPLNKRPPLPFPPPPPPAGASRTPTTTLAPQKSELTLLCERFQQQFGHIKVRCRAGARCLLCTAGGPAGLLHRMTLLSPPHSPLMGLLLDHTCGKPRKGWRFNSVQMCR